MVLSQLYNSLWVLYEIKLLICMVAHLVCNPEVMGSDLLIRHCVTILWIVCSYHHMCFCHKASESGNRYFCLIFPLHEMIIFCFVFKLYPMAVVGTSNRGIIIYQLENQPAEYKRMESPLKFQVAGVLHVQGVDWSLLISKTAFIYIYTFTQT